MKNELDGVWIYKGEKYRFQCEGKLKHPVTREWMHAVHYVALDGPVVYVRERADFLAKFERYDPPNDLAQATEILRRLIGWAEDVAFMIPADERKTLNWIPLKDAKVVFKKMTGYEL